MVYSGFDNISLADMVKKIFEPNPNKLLVRGFIEKNLDMINAALSKGADPDTPLNKRIGVPIICFTEEQSIIEALLDGGANVRIAEYYERLGRLDLADIVYKWQDRQKPKEEERTYCNFDLNFY